MNHVSLSSIARYSLANKGKIVAIIVLFVIIGLSLGYYLIQSDLSKDPVVLDQDKVMANRRYYKALNNEIIYTEMYPQTLTDKLYLAQKTYVILPQEPERQMSLNALFEKLRIDGEAVQERYNQLAGADFSAHQVMRMGLFETQRELYSMSLSAHGPNQASADFLLAEMDKLFLARSDELAIPHLIEQVDYIQRETSQIIFFDRAKNYLSEIAKKRSDHFMSIPAPPARKSLSDLLRYGLMGLTSGIAAAFLLALFGSAGNPKYYNIAEQAYSGSALLGAYSTGPAGVKLHNRLFAGSKIAPVDELTSQAMFRLLPELNNSQELLVIHDDIDISTWQANLSQYHQAIRFLELSDGPEIFQALKDHPPVLAIVQQPQLEKIQSMIPEQLIDQSAIVIAL